MVIDVHCHVGLSARRADRTIARFSFERDGASGTAGYDTYLSPRMLARPAFFFVRRWLKIDSRLERGDRLDRAIEEVNQRQWDGATSVDRLVLLAFDEYHRNDGTVVGMAARGEGSNASDMYTSNSFVRALCAAAPERFLFGGSIHPYRAGACAMLEELAASGVKLIKWLPIHQNIDVEDMRTVAFLQRAALLGIPMLIHYGGESSTASQHREFESPIPFLKTLRGLRQEGMLPTVIVAHVATPSFIWQSARGCHALVEALTGEFLDAPLYADISALAAFGRTPWLRRFAKQKTLHRKLIYGSDYPIPPMIGSFWMSLSSGERRRIKALPSWIEQDIQLKRALGFEECVFAQAAEILRAS